MFHNNILHVFVVVFGLCSIGDCSVVASKRSTIIGGGEYSSKFDCSQFKDDLDVLRQFPFPVKLNPTVDEYYTYEKSTAQISEDGTFIEKIIIKNTDRVPLSLFCLSNLTSLTIKSTSFENDIVPDALGYLKNLKYLEIASVYIKKMTEQLTTLTNLEIIMLFGCALTHLPDIKNLHKLNNLYLPYNNLVNIDVLKDLELEALDLAGNNLTEIPVLKNKKKLSFLSLSNNPLKNAETAMLYRNLHYLYMDHTMMTTLPSTIDKLQQLEYLFIFGNQLTTLPPGILNLPKLQMLIANANLFSNDYIESIEKAFHTHRPTTMLIM